MLRCSWCMKKIKESKPVLGLSVKFGEGVDFSESEGTIIQIGLKTRNTTVHIIVTDSGSEAKNKGTDGIFALCSDKCVKKMKDTVTKELTTLDEFTYEVIDESGEFSLSEKQMKYLTIFPDITAFDRQYMAEMRKFLILWL